MANVLKNHQRDDVATVQAPHTGCSLRPEQDRHDQNCYGLLHRCINSTPIIGLLAKAALVVDNHAAKCVAPYFRSFAVEYVS